MDIEQLREKAKSLNIKKVTSLSKKELQAQINQVQANIKASTESDAKKEEANTAIVLNEGGQEVRRYSLNDHGENFIELAKEFASDREYKLQFKNVKPGVPCPSCGYVIHLEDVA